jgi:predicted metal-dependent phosphoesterase TrpH
MKRLTFFAFFIFLFITSYAQQTTTDLNVNKVYYPSYSSDERIAIVFPKVNGYEVLTCDFHSHTMFSDGLVWPTLRVSEAWSQGLDAIAITDHIEYRPFRRFTTNDHNTSYNIAKETADELGFMLIKGTEITRKQSVFGHFNALFIKDANTLDVKDPKEALREARKQGAFIIWNHPGWAVDSTYIRTFQQEVIDEGLVDGIEVFNNHEFYPRVMKWAIEKGLAVIAASDVHGNVEKSSLEKYKTHRPMTLVFAKERTLEGIFEALKSGRTLAYFHNTLAGKEDLARNFVIASIKVSQIEKDTENTSYSLINQSDFTFKINQGEKVIELPALSKIVIIVPNNTSSAKLVFNNIFVQENRVLAHDLQLK